MVVYSLSYTEEEPHVKSLSHREKDAIKLSTGTVHTLIYTDQEPHVKSLSHSENLFSSSIQT